MNPIAVAEVQRGDLLLVTHRENDALANLIMELDGSPDGFSHCGIALDGQRILSAFPDFADVGGLEFGGLSNDDFGFFWDHSQHIHRLEVEPGERAVALERLPCHLPPSGGFSIPKIVMVAAVLHALAPGNRLEPEAVDQVVHSAIAAAERWAGDGDYYCAEFVAEVYDWDFTLGDLRRPTTNEEAFVPSTLAALTVRKVEALLTAGRSAREKALLHVFVEDVLEHDPSFFEEGLRATLDALLRRAPREVKTKKAEVRERRGDVGSLSLDDATPLPRPLVTPRMLRARRQHAGIPEIPQSD